MSTILDNFIPVTTPFTPKTPRELFALRLAQKLQDAPAVRHYLSLTDSYSDGQLLMAYRRALRNINDADLARCFHLELKQSRSNGYHDHRVFLISIRIERRTVAAAVFRGEQLEYTDSRQLSSNHQRALASTVGFINWMLDRFSVDSAALEAIPNGKEFHRRELYRSIETAFRNEALPIWSVSKSELFQGCGHPVLRSRKELRAIATAIWPILAGTNAKLFIQDAAILGLHVQIERSFIIN